MSINISLHNENKLMILRFNNRLDLSLSREICSVCDLIVPQVRLCILDMREVDRIFDSGVALLGMLCKRLKEIGAEISFHGMHPELRRHMSYILPV